jgi:hypothetical protein
MIGSHTHVCLEELTVASTFALLRAMRKGKIHAPCRDVGFFPILSQPSGMSDSKWRLLKLAVYSRCLDVLLDEVKKASKDGIPGLPDPNGVERFVVPVLMSYVTDDPEAHDMSACKSGNLPCELCLVR